MLISRFIILFLIFGLCALMLKKHIGFLILSNVEGLRLKCSVSAPVSLRSPS